MLKKIWTTFTNIRKAPLRTDVGVGVAVTSVAAVRLFSTEDEIWEEYKKWTGPYVTDGGEAGKAAQERLDRLNAKPSEMKDLKDWEIKAAKFDSLSLDAEKTYDLGMKKCHYNLEQAVKTNEDQFLKLAMEAEDDANKALQMSLSFKEAASEIRKKHEVVVNKEK